MTSAKYIGMDVHKESVSIAVLNFAGKVVMECVIETKASTILQFIHGLRGDLQVTFEEGTWAGWLYDLLKPHVTELVVCNPRKIALLKDGSKSDRIDAHKLADLLYMNKIKPVYHGEHGLRMLKELSRSYLTISKDLGRVMNRLKALYRSWAIPCAGTQVYAPRYRSEWLSKISEAGVRRRAELYYQQLDALRLVRQQARSNEVATPDSWYWSASSGSLGCRNADASSVPHQAATVDLQRAGVGDPRQRAVPRRGATATTLEQNRYTARSQYESQPRPQRYFQGCSYESQHRCWTATRFLRSFVDQGKEAHDGALDLGAEDCRDHVDRLEEGGTFRRQLFETTSSLSASGRESVPSLGGHSRRWPSGS
jgi:hypothetical protein